MGDLAIVTGASSGIGQAYAERLARDGWDLVVVARRRERLEGVAQQLGRDHGVTVRVMGADLARHEQLLALRDELARLPVVLLVNSAALAHYMPFVELPPEVAAREPGRARRTGPRSCPPVPHAAHRRGGHPR